MILLQDASSKLLVQWVYCTNNCLLYATVAGKSC